MNFIDEKKPSAELTAKPGALPAHSNGHTDCSAPTFAQGSLHELSSICTILLGYAELAKRELCANSPARYHLMQVEAGCGRLKEFCDLLRDFSGADQSKKEPVDLNALIEGVAKVLPASGIDLALNCKAPLPLVAGNPMKLRQLLLAVLENSVEAEADRILIETGVRSFKDVPALTKPRNETDSDSYVFIEIADSGTGIDMEILPYICDPFFTTKFVGRGMGLSAALGIMKNHSGELLVRNDPDTGAVVTLCFPNISMEPQTRHQANYEPHRSL